MKGGRAAGRSRVAAGSLKDQLRTLGEGRVGAPLEQDGGVGDITSKGGNTLEGVRGGRG